MNLGKRSIALQTRIRSLREERERIRREIARLRQELRRLTPKRPHTGIQAAILRTLREAGRPLTSAEIAERLPQFCYHRVQIAAHQVHRLGRAGKERIAEGRPWPRYRFFVHDRGSDAA